MVFVRHPLLGPAERLDLRSAAGSDGPCLVLEYPGGKRSVHRFENHAALSVGTARIHAQLIRDGWESPDLSSTRYLR